MSNHMFKSEEITVKIGQDGQTIICSSSRKSTIESCPATGYVNYRAGGQ